jgi:hypothetical protein
MAGWPLFVYPKYFCSQNKPAERRSHPFIALLTGVVTGIIFLLSVMFFWNATFDSQDSIIYGLKRSSSTYNRAGEIDSNERAMVRMIGESGTELVLGVLCLGVGFFGLGISFCLYKFRPRRI